MHLREPFLGGPGVTCVSSRTVVTGDADRVGASPALSEERRLIRAVIGRSGRSALCSRRYCCSVSQTQRHTAGLCVLLLLLLDSPSSGINLTPVQFSTMDATIYQIIFGEFGDPNCSLIEAFQDTFWENASFSLQSIDGEIEMILYPFEC